MAQTLRSIPVQAPDAGVVRRLRHLEPVGENNPTPVRAPVRLRADTLPLLPPPCAVPGYDRAALTTGVVHLGVGNFHRAHQAVYFDDLAHLGHTAWGVAGVGLRSRQLHDALTEQDLLFTVVERDGAGDRARVVGAMHRYTYAPQAPQRALGWLAAASTHLVTLTLTGDGYPLDASTGQLRPDDDVRHDLAHPTEPRSAFGYLVEALERRRRSGGRGLTVLSCDNRSDSAQAARGSVIALAEERDPALARWIEAHVRFPDSMVDRITPATDDERRRWVRDDLGVDDRSPVVCEPFRQWVVEDAFAGERPPLDQVGVQLVPDVGPYKLVKTRLLNGGHCALGYLGLLAGYTDTAEAMADPWVERYLRTLMATEIGPGLPALPGVDLADYQDTLLTRFGNPVLVDPLSRLAARASTKLPTYLLPSLADALRQNRPYELLALAVAAWVRCLQRPGGAGGRPVNLEDARAVELKALARHRGDDARAVLVESGLFGELGQDARLTATVQRLVHDLRENGWEATVAACLSVAASR